MDDQHSEGVSRTNGAATRARERAQQHRAAGRLRDAAIFQLNGLAHDPSDATLLTEHVAVVFALAEQSQGAADLEEASALLDELERTLSGLLERTDPDNVDGVRAHLRAVEEQHTRLLAATRPAPKADPDAPEPKLAATFARISRGAWDWSVPQKDASARLAEVATLLEGANEAQAEVDRATCARLGEYVDALRRAVSVDEACADAAQVMKSSSEEDDLRVCLAMLQQAEASLRGVLPMVRTLDQPRQENLLRRLDGVSRALDSVLSAQRAQRSKARWQAYLTMTADARAEAERWTPGPPNGEAKYCDAQLQRIQRLIDSAGEVLRELEDPEVRRAAGAHLREVSSLASRAAAAQREAYGRWAINLVQQCFEQASQYIKVTGDDEEAMDETIVETLGEVNPALLSTEAGRAYSEVLEYLLSKLYAPGKDKGFEKPGARLHVLKRLAKHNKSTLSDF